LAGIDWKGAIKLVGSLINNASIRVLHPGMENPVLTAIGQDMGDAAQQLQTGIDKAADVAGYLGAPGALVNAFIKSQEGKYADAATSLATLSLSAIPGEKAGGQAVTKGLGKLLAKDAGEETANVLGKASAKSSLVAGEAGSYGELAAKAVRGDKLTPHHMPQAAAGYTGYSEGGALVLPEGEHLMTRTFAGKGSKTLVEDSALSFRQTLYKDMRDIRSQFGTRYNSGMSDLIKYYKSKFPDLMAK
jgi:hypothetical protein